MEKTFYFEAQSAMMRDWKPSFSNFFQYEIPDTPGNRSWIQSGIDSAELRDGGWTYPEGFIAELNRKYSPYR